MASIEVCSGGIEFGWFSTENELSKISIGAGGNVSGLRASDLVISRGFPEFGPSKKGNYSF